MMASIKCVRALAMIALAIPLLAASAAEARRQPLLLRDV